MSDFFKTYYSFDGAEEEDINSFFSNKTMSHDEFNEWLSTYKNEMEEKERLRLSKMTQDERDIEEVYKEFGLVQEHKSNKPVNQINEPYKGDFFKSLGIPRPSKEEVDAFFDGSDIPHRKSLKDENLSEAEIEAFFNEVIPKDEVKVIDDYDYGIEFYSSVLKPYDVLTRECEEVDRKAELKKQSYRDLYNSVGVNYEPYYFEIKQNAINDYNENKDRICNEFNLTEKEQESMFFSFKKEENSKNSLQEVDGLSKTEFKFHYNPSKNLKPRFVYAKPENDTTKYIKFIEIPDYINFRKDGVYYSTGTKRKKSFIQLSSYGLYSYTENRVKLFYEPTKDEDDYKLVREYLTTFKYLNNNEKYYEYYMIWLSVYFTDFRDLKSFTKWYRKIRVKKEWLRKEYRKIIIDGDYCNNHGLDKDLYLKQKNKEYGNRLNGLLNEQFIMRIYNERKPKCYEIIQAFTEERHISIDMIKNVLNSKGIHLKNEADDKNERYVLGLIDDCNKYIRLGRHFNKLTTRLISLHLKRSYRHVVSPATVSRILNEHKINLNEINEKNNLNKNEA
jgi:hypothetical protein